ncbi:MAG: nuclear transport factor 2 family protein [Gammaproteobacteria bacterium]|nr:nuclear transport factor 2 family protein [Gammaproteobacteria bacterium]
MDSINAFALIEQYIDGWKENNLNKIAGCLTENITIIESHGPTYSGIESVNHWFDLWLKAQSHVVRWDIHSMHFCEHSQAAFCEWDFACVISGVEYALPGVSMVKFSGQKINLIHEYRMTKPPCPWDGQCLQSV